MLKEEVRNHWEKETCGTRYGSAENRRLYFDEMSAARYTLEPYIQAFADFPAGTGRSVLEIGVGAGADFLNWCIHAEHATGVDLTQAAIDLTRERLILNSVPPSGYSLLVADAEDLPFDDGVFDVVYSWGALHHTPDTERSVAEAFRVLRPGGTIKVDGLSRAVLDRSLSIPQIRPSPGASSCVTQRADWSASGKPWYQGLPTSRDRRAITPSRLLWHLSVHTARAQRSAPRGAQ